MLVTVELGEALSWEWSHMAHASPCVQPAAPMVPGGRQWTGRSTVRTKALGEPSCGLDRLPLPVIGRDRLLSWASPLQG